VLRAADRIIATSQNYIASSPYLKEVSEKCIVIPLGIDLALSEKADESSVQAIRERFGEPLLLFTGMLRYYKGLEYLLEAMQGIEARLLVVGIGPMERKWKRLAERLGLAGRVFFLGEIPEVELPLYYHACEVFVLPASHRSEAFGVVQLEAMAAGKPVVSTKLGTGTSFVNVHGQTGLVVPPRDPEALRIAINRLLADESLRRMMGERGRQRVREFSKERMVERITALYEEI
jgi:rhamnosyl/mannosyltransferase